MYILESSLRKSFIGRGIFEERMEIMMANCSVNLHTITIAKSEQIIIKYDLIKLKN